MKFLLMFFIFMVLLYQWRNRSAKVGQAQRKNTPPPGPVSIVECAQCGLHLPASEAVQGKRGVYCSAAHQQARES
jgi:uncharacterized protein